MTCPERQIQREKGGQKKGAKKVYKKGREGGGDRRERDREHTLIAREWWRKEGLRVIIGM
jgi:hypothetical protein